MNIVMGVPKWWNETHCANADCRKRLFPVDNIHRVRITLIDDSTVDKCLCDACYEIACYETAENGEVRE
jgi:hypothetical protein